MEDINVSTRLVLPQLDLPNTMAKDGYRITSLSCNNARERMSHRKGEKYSHDAKVK